MDQFHTTETLWTYFEVNEHTQLFHPYLPKRKVNKENHELASKPSLKEMLPLTLMELMA